LDAFLIGLKLDDWYDNSDDCLDSIIATFDDYEYFLNNLTLVEKDPNEGLISLTLNFTGIVASNFA